MKREGIQTGARDATNCDNYSLFIESQIDGDFEGYDSDKIYKLMNGQIWKQISAEYEYQYSFMPNVTIYRDSPLYKMKVDGMDESVTVEQIK